MYLDLHTFIHKILYVATIAQHYHSCCVYSFVSLRIASITAPGPQFFAYIIASTPCTEHVTLHLQQETSLSSP